MQRLHRMKQNKIREKDTNCECFFNAIRQEDFAKIESMVRAGYDINYTNQSTSAIHLAISTQNLEIVEFLLKRKSLKKDVRDCDGASALVTACRMNINTACIRSLIKHSCDVNLREFSGKSALHFAIRAGNESVVQALIDNGADVNQFGCFETPVLTAIWCDRVSILAMLLYYNADMIIYHTYTLLFGRPSPWLVLNKSKALLELFLPYIDMRDYFLLLSCDIPLLQKIWSTREERDKRAFASWCVQAIDDAQIKWSINNRVQWVFHNLFYKDLTSAEPGMFFHGLFEEEELYELMYYPATSVSILGTFNAFLDITDMMIKSNDRSRKVDQLFASYLKLLLSNYNRIDGSHIMDYLSFALLPSATLAVMEDMNVKIADALVGIDNVKCRICWWHRYITKVFDSNVGDGDEVCVNTNEEIYKYFNIDKAKP